jgi:hypothetical protein
MITGGLHMTLASIPATANEGSISPVDAYLLEGYLTAESTRPAAGPRFSSIGAFLAFVGLVTAALAMLFAIPEGESRPLIPGLCMTLGIIGVVVSVSFYALEVGRQRNSSRAARIDGPTDAAASIYQASIGFFGFAVAIGTALLLVR